MRLRLSAASLALCFPIPSHIIPMLHAASPPGPWARALGAEGGNSGKCSTKDKTTRKKKHLSEASLLTLLTVAARYDWPEKEMGPVSLMRLLILPGAALYALQCGFSLLSVRYALRPSSSSRYSLRFEIFYTRARSAQFRLRRELPCTRVVQFCLRRKLPAPGTKGGLFCICVESRNLT
jgi:hypothetical protein